MPQTDKRIVYLSWPANEVSGGIKMAFKHVESLCSSGYAACVATPEARRPSWFKSSAPLIAWEAAVRGQDVLVFPENHPGLLRQFRAWENPKVVFCQNQYMIARGVNEQGRYMDFGVRFLICPGFECAAFCRRRCPGVEIHIVPNYVDGERFAPAPTKRLRIACMPRKRPFELGVIRDLFRTENANLADIPWVEIAGKPEEEVVATLRESAVFLSLCRFEALPLTLLEAFSSGCVVAGFTGIGGRDYATSGNGFWAAEDDCLACVDQLTQAVRTVREGGPRLQAMIEASLQTARNYGEEAHRAALVRCWEQILASYAGIPL